ncbi:hypothetical protein [Curtobacterium flaccumfaciens]|uniref:hypothetical protein n=1 Tax=Curtobacterium flaccumfaciens TaxID=2035 RepID=UPI001BDE5E4C|nr:hypothetical protein [Curtobacterium flaccumfaciens]MBT1633258.1 hypothetical protein [Curtobacterium flaccumfaciens pv. oortii]MCX2846905.1 hypothetical protein [Curtobacterium flaccumfaciens pv. oortii]
MTDRTDDLIVQDNYDLAVALATALRDARSAGDPQWERSLAATLAQTAHHLSLAVDPGQEVMPAITHLNGYPDSAAIRTLLRQ